MHLSKIFFLFSGWSTYMHTHSMINTCITSYTYVQRKCQKVRPGPFSFSSMTMLSFGAISSVKWFTQSPTFTFLKNKEFSIGTTLPIRLATPSEFTGRLFSFLKLHNNTDVEIWWHTDEYGKYQFCVNRKCVSNGSVYQYGRRQGRVKKPDQHN